MTPLKPLPNTERVRGVAAKRYPRNETCAHPECDKPTESVHHIFGRPPGPDSDSWFVEVGPMDVPRPSEKIPDLVEHGVVMTIPHAIGLCGSGTTGHHGELEYHSAWIKLEDGVFNWYERVGTSQVPPSEEWKLVGPLDPQPARGEKRKKAKRKKGAEKSTRETFSIRVPQGFADGGQVWEDLFGDGKDGEPVGRVRERLDALGAKGDNPIFEVIVDMANDWLNG